MECIWSAREEEEGRGRRRKLLIGEPTLLPEQTRKKNLFHLHTWPRSIEKKYFLMFAMFVCAEFSPADEETQNQGD